MFRHTSRRHKHKHMVDMAAPRRRLAVLLAAVLFLSHQASAANRYTVGGSKAWNPNVNYTEWAKKHAPFYVGDWLVFYYSSGMADVVQVDEAGFNKCDATHPIMNYSKGRSFAFELNQTKRYYFICSLGYCYQGMKLTIRAQPLPPPSPPPKPSAALRRRFPAAVAVFTAVFAALI